MALVGASNSKYACELISKILASARIRTGADGGRRTPVGFPDRQGRGAPGGWDIGFRHRMDWAI
jgi:hypothetical protein